MHDVRDLKNQLEALGDAAVPPARPEFRQALLTRLLDSAPVAADGLVIDPTDDPVVIHAIAEPIDLNKRRRTRVLAVQAAAAISIAAAAAGVLGVVSLVDRSPSTNGTALAEPSGKQEAALASSDSGIDEDVVITATGQLQDADGKPATLRDGAAQMTCASEMTFNDVNGNTYRCGKGQVVSVLVEGSAIASSTAQTAPAAIGRLTLDPPSQEQPLRWTWARYDDPRFDHYELVRVDGLVEGADLTNFTVVARTTSGDPAETGFVETDTLDHAVTYQLLARAADGTVLARSDLTQLTLQQD